MLRIYGMDREYFFSFLCGINVLNVIFSFLGGGYACEVLLEILKFILLHDLLNHVLRIIDALSYRSYLNRSQELVNEQKNTVLLQSQIEESLLQKKAGATDCVTCD